MVALAASTALLVMTFWAIHKLYGGTLHFSYTPPMQMTSRLVLSDDGEYEDVATALQQVARQAPIANGDRGGLVTDTGELTLSTFKVVERPTHLPHEVYTLSRRNQVDQNYLDNVQLREQLAAALAEARCHRDALLVARADAGIQDLGIRTLSELCSSLQERASRLATTALNLEARLAEKDMAIIQLTEDIRGKKAAIFELEETLTTKEITIIEMGDLLAEKDASICDLEWMQKGNAAAMRKLEEELAERGVQMTACIADRETTISQLRRSLEAQEDETKEIIAQSEYSIARLMDRLSECNEQLVASRGEHCVKLFVKDRFREAVILEGQPESITTSHRDSRTRRRPSTKLSQLQRNSNEPLRDSNINTATI